MKTINSFELRLKKAGNSNPKRSSEELAAAAMDCKPLDVYFREPSPEQEQRLDAMILRAEHGEPIQYIIGHVDFFGLEIRCDRRALIPRPETELLVEQVLKTISRCGFRSSNPLRIADVGAGTGCIGLAIVANVANAILTAVDISPDALALAGDNAERLELKPRYRLLQNNLLEGFENHSLEIIVSNPPYISSEVCKALEPCVRDFEPGIALDGGEDGMCLIRPLVLQSARVLKPGGWLFLEIGYDQGPHVVQELEQAGFEQVQLIRDLAGLDRIVSGSIKPS